MAAVLLVALPLVCLTYAHRIRQLLARVTQLEGLVLAAHARVEAADLRAVEAEHVADRLALALDPTAPTSVLTAAWAGVL